MSHSAEYSKSPKMDPVKGETVRKEESACHRWKILAFGQGLSCLLAATMASQSTLFLECDWTSPAFSCFWAYLLLSFHAFPLMCRGRSVGAPQNNDDDNNINTTTTAPAITPPYWFLRCIPLQTSPLAYFGMALVSFYGNYAGLTALRLTTITSTSIFDAMAVPTTMVLSYFLVGRRYARLHLLGASMCLIGLFLNAGVDIVSNHMYNQAVSEEQLDPSSSAVKDLHEDGSEEYPHKIIGDMLACLGGIFFGANDVFAELTVRRNGGSPTEYLAMIGFFGVLIAVTQAIISEQDQITALFNGTTGCGGTVTAGLLVIYIVSQFSRKVGLANFLTASDAALLSLSLLTSDLYASIFSMIYQQIFPRALFWVAMALVVVGIVLYELGRSPIIVDTKKKGKAIDQDGVMKTSSLEL